MYETVSNGYVYVDSIQTIFKPIFKGMPYINALFIFKIIF